MHPIRLFVLCASTLLLAPASATARPDKNYERGLTLMEELEYGKAIKALGRALGNPDNTPQDRALIILHIGVIQSSQMDQQAAAESFERALKEDRAVRPPASISPKIMALFEEVLARFERHVPEEPAPRPEATTAPPPPPDPERDQEPPGTNWPAWITLGAGLVAGGAGIALGASSRGAREEAEDREVPFTQAQEHLDRANTQALAANILFIAAGVAAVTSGVLFYLGWDREEELTASLAPSPFGLMIQLKLFR